MLTLGFTTVVLLAAQAAEPVRVAGARARVGSDVQEAVRAVGVQYPPRAVLLRAYKHERRFEVWVGDDPTKPLVLLETLPVCASSGTLGPKLREGDLQVPEGVYRIDKLNPVSTFHLGLHVDYPNAADRARGARRGVDKLGGAIMVHGNCVTIGCIPLEDGPIERVYLLVNDARARGVDVGLHVYPRVLDDDGLRALLAGAPDEDTRALWQELAPIERAFERERVVPRVRITRDGRYELRERARAPR